MEDVHSPCLDLREMTVKEVCQHFVPTILLSVDEVWELEVVADLHKRYLPKENSTLCLVVLVVLKRFFED